jgi:hypothetical protein
LAYPIENFSTDLAQSGLSRAPDRARIAFAPGLTQSSGQMQSKRPVAKLFHFLLTRNWSARFVSFWRIGNLGELLILLGEQFFDSPEAAHNDKGEGDPNGGFYCEIPQPGGSALLIREQLTNSQQTFLVNQVPGLEVFTRTNSG